MNNVENFGTVSYEGKKYILLEDAYLTGTGEGHYQALAIYDRDEKDEDGNQQEYMVTWAIRADYDPCDPSEEYACNWDEASCVEKY